MSFSSETEHAARKVRLCDECGHRIAVGERYSRWAGTTDGEFQVWVSHIDCRAAVVRLNKLAGTDWDEWMSLSDLESEDRPWLCEEFPAVAARLGWSLYDWREPRLNHDAVFGRGSHYIWQGHGL